jgi:hypothetical protein
VLAPDSSSPEPRGVEHGSIAVDAVPSLTIVSYMETEEGTITAILRRWPTRGRTGPHYHGACPHCVATEGLCLVQVRGRVEPADAPLFDADRYGPREFRRGLARM